MATCSSADSVLEAASQIKSNASKLDTFVNGTASQTVQLGSGAPTPSLRKFVAEAQDIVTLAANDAAQTVMDAVSANTQGKADKVADAVEGHLAALDDTGNLTDSGIAAPTITQDGEFIRRINDEDGNFLFGIRYDGTVEWVDGVPKPIREFVEKLIKSEVVTGGYYVFQIVDAQGKALFSIGKDGVVDWEEGVPKPVKEYVDKYIEEKTIRGGCDLWHIKDASGKIVFSVNNDGSIDWATGIPKHVRDFAERHVHVRHDVASPYVSTQEDSAGRAFALTDVNGDTRQYGSQKVVGSMKVSGEIVCDKIKGVLNWSKASSIKIPEIPKCAVVNIKGFARPVSKADERHAVMEFWDGRGNYFEKNILIGLQGNTTWNLPKPNYKFDIIRGDWNDLDEDEDVVTCKVQFGNWVPSDSFHLKAFWTDFTKCRAIISYKIWEEINKTYPIDKDATWKRALLPADPYAPNGELPAFSCTHDLDLRIDTGATCRFDAFPCLVYHNGEFYGVFAFQQKKQRENFQMNKKNFRHIHLDGFVGASLCTGVPDYGSIEIRNPKKLVCWDGSDYDGDAPMRLITRQDAGWKNKDKYTNTEITDLAIKAIAQHLVSIGNMDENIQAMIANEASQADIDAAIATLKETFETYFDIENVIDMVAHVTWDSDWDSVTNNTQWTTWDGVKWYLNRYDANGAFEGNSRWHGKPGSISHVQGGTTKNHPFHIVEAYYFDELCARYAELRRLRILDADHFIGMVQDWMLAVGFDFYKKEFEMWPTQNCLGEMNANHACWELVLDGNGKPIRCDGSSASAEDRALPTFSLTATYQPGDVVKAFFTSWSSNSPSNQTASGYWKMECVAPGPCRGVPPFDTRYMNAPDSVYRLYYWVKLHQDKVDAFFGYVS